MKYILLFSLFAPTILFAQVVNFQWAKQMGGTENGETGYSVTTDGTGNVYTTGAFRNTIDFDPGPGIYNLTATAGTLDMFVSKLDAFGNFVWAKQMKSSDSLSGAIGYSITLDDFGNVYTTGSFIGDVDFDPGPSIFMLSASTFYNGTICFICKLDTTGNFVWAKQMGETTDDGGGGGQSIKTDSAGNVYTSGAFGFISDFDPGPGTFYLDGGLNNIFISKLDPAGNFILAKAPQLFPNSPAYANEARLSIDVAGNIYCAGNFGGELDFDPGPGVFSLDSDPGPNGWGRRDIFVWKLTAGGNFAWAKKIGGSIINGEYNGVCDMIGDSAGNVYTIGYFIGTVDFDPGPGIYQITAATFPDNYVSKLNSNGDFVWAFRSPWGNSISLDTFENIYITGKFVGTVDFDPGPGIFNLTSFGGSDIFVWRLVADGNFVWAKQMGGIGNEHGNAISLDSLGNIYTTGIFNGIADFDPGPNVYNLTSAGGSDIFVVKLNLYVPLPVIFGEFKAYQKYSDIELAWKILTEINTYKYEVEKSTDGRIFIKIGEVMARGGNGIIDYTYLDVNPFNGNNFYRLKVIDRDGNFKYSSIVNVRINSDKDVFRLAPNPVQNGSAVLQMEGVAKGLYTLDLFNSMGQDVKRIMIDHPGGSASQTIVLNNLAAGIYKLRIAGVNKLVYKAIVIQ